MLTRYERPPGLFPFGWRAASRGRRMAAVEETRAARHRRKIPRRGGMRPKAGEMRPWLPFGY